MKTFGSELRELLNRYSKENESNTPDYILTNYILNCLEAFEVAISQRDNHMELNNNSYEVNTESFRPTY